MYDLESSLKNKQRQQAAGYIKIASKMIAQCPDPEKRAKAIKELMKLQKHIKQR